jgi:hypothetical protein
MHMSQSLFYLTTALHVSGFTITHLQEHKTIVTTASGNRYTALLSAAIMESWNRFECVVGGVRHPQHTQTSSSSSTIAADNITV